MDNATGGLVLAMAVEIAELQRQLARAQDSPAEISVDAGRLHAQIEHLQAELTEAHAERDAWQARAEQNRHAG